MSNTLLPPDMTYKAVVHVEAEGGYWAEVPDLPGCFTQGDTLDELYHNLPEAIALPSKSRKPLALAMRMNGLPVAKLLSPQKALQSSSFALDTCLPVWYNAVNQLSIGRGRFQWFPDSKR